MRSAGPLKTWHGNCHYQYFLTEKLAMSLSHCWALINSVRVYYFQKTQISSRRQEGRLDFHFFLFSNTPPHLKILIHWIYQTPARTHKKHICSQIRKEQTKNKDQTQSVDLQVVVQVQQWGPTGSTLATFAPAKTGNIAVLICADFSHFCIHRYGNKAWRWWWGGVSEQSLIKYSI